MIKQYSERLTDGQRATVLETRDDPEMYLVEVGSTPEDGDVLAVGAKKSTKPSGNRKTDRPRKRGGFFMALAARAQACRIRVERDEPDGR